MAMTVVVTRNVPERVRGFLASCMCELGAGVYTAPRMDAAVRDRVWDVLIVWCGLRNDLSVVMTWPEPKLPGGQAVRTLGTPPVELIEHNGVFLARRDLTEDDVRSLTTRFGGRIAPDAARDAVTTAVDSTNPEISGGRSVVAIPHTPSSLEGTVLAIPHTPSSLGGTVVAIPHAPSSVEGTVLAIPHAPSSLDGRVLAIPDDPSSPGGTALAFADNPSSRGITVVSARHSLHPPGALIGDETVRHDSRAEAPRLPGAVTSIEHGSAHHGHEPSADEENEEV